MRIKRQISFFILFAMGLFLIGQFAPVTKAEDNYESWVGQKVVFLPQTKRLQKYGYSFSYSPDCINSINNSAELSGKVATLKRIYRDDLFNKPYGEFSVENGKKVYAKLNIDSLGQIAFTSEMDEAKKYIGCTFWNLRKTFSEIYDWDADKFTQVPLKNLEPMTVVEVKWWYDGSSPVWFVLKRQDGSIAHWRGYCKNVTWPIPSGKSIEQSWLLADPKTTHPDWKPEIWDQIENFKVSLGMKRDMVLLSWGEPKSKNFIMTDNKFGEQWFYGNRYVYLENNIVTELKTY